MGKGIQHDVDLLEHRQMFLLRRNAVNLDSVRVQPLGRHTLPIACLEPAGLQLGNFYQQLAVWNRQQGFGPEIQHAIVYFFISVETAEGDVTVSEGGQGARVRKIDQGLIGRGAGQVQDGLGKKMSLYLGQYPRIVEQIIDARQAGTDDVPPTAGLHRGRTVGKQLQAVAGGVAGEIHQNIDAVLADQSFHFLIGAVQYGVPTVGRFLETLSYRILFGLIGVAVEFKRVPVVMEQGHAEGRGRRMHPKIPGDVTNAQFTFRVRVVVMPGRGDGLNDKAP